MKPNLLYPNKPTGTSRNTRKGKAVFSSSNNGDFIALKVGMYLYHCISMNYAQGVDLSKSCITILLSNQVCTFIVHLPMTRCSVFLIVSSDMCPSGQLLLDLARSILFETYERVRHILGRPDCPIQKI